MKKYIIAGVVITLISIAYAIFKPPQTIETTKAIIMDSKIVKRLEREKSQIMTAKTVIEKKLNEAREINKNIDIHIEYYPDGKIKSKDIIDRSKTTIKTDSTSVATSTVTVTTIEKVKAETTETKTVTTIETKTKTYSEGISLLIGPTIFARTEAFNIKEYRIDNFGIAAGIKIDNVLINANYLFIPGIDDIIALSIQIKP